MLLGASARVTGSSHVRSGTVCQDYVTVESFDEGKEIVAVLCDGAGSCSRSELGAEALCRGLPHWLKDEAARLTSIRGEELGREIVTKSREILAEAAERNGVGVRELSSTLLIAWVHKRDSNLEYRLIHLGDGIAACISSNGKVTVSTPERGEFANETIFVPSKGARDAIKVTKGMVEPGSGFLLMSDGTAESLFLKKGEHLAPACADMLAWLNDNDQETVSIALEQNLANTLSQKTEDDCSLALLLDRDSGERFEVEIEHPQPKPEPKIMSQPKKLIEVSIPLQEINEASAREKSIRHGHPSTLHLWWARRPLAAARAVLFCQLVDDPSGYVDELLDDKLARQRAQAEVDMELEMTPQVSPKLEEKLVERERERLHQIVRELVIWENTTNETVLNRARKEIQKSWQRSCRRAGKPEDTPMPPVLDPFAGGGAIPLEAQRLGMEAHASDLNPVAVLINKAMIEIPPKFAGMPPVNPEWQEKSKEEKAATTWKEAQGLAEDVRYYGEWMRKEAEKRIGDLYPPYEITQEILNERSDLVDAGYKPGDKLTVMAWLWARTVPSPNPALNGKPVPLVSSFWLSKKKGKEAYVEPVVQNGEYRFEIRIGVPPGGELPMVETVNRKGGVCLISGTAMPFPYIREKGKEGKIEAVPFATVCEGKSGRIYLAGLKTNSECESTWRPTNPLPQNPRDFKTPNYGMDEFGDLFTSRQLIALTTFSDLVEEARDKLIEAAKASSDPLSHLEPYDDARLEVDGHGPHAYADAVAVYLSFIQSKCSDYWSNICSWHSSGEKLRNTFGRQAIPMVWDYTEANPFCSSSGTYQSMANWVYKVVKMLPAKGTTEVHQLNASTRRIKEGTIISSDPPYYDNIGYAELSDFFYVWLRRSLREIMPQFMGGILAPKEEELIASPYRHGGKAEAEDFFLSGMTNVAKKWSGAVSPEFPTTIYYAFKQAEVKTEGIASTGWATFLGALIDAGFAIVGTWPVRTELVNKIGQKANMLASSIVLVCRHRSLDAPMATRREFIQLLNSELPTALASLLNGNIAPVDLPQSAIGPGMAIFSRFSKIVEAGGSPMSVTTALQLINKAVDEILSEQEAEMDEWTRFAVTWFSQYGYKTGPYGDAEQIANARNVSVDGVAVAGIIESGGGKVRIYRPEELPEDWDPEEDDRLTIWEIAHHLIRKIESEGEQAAAEVLARIGGLGHDARRLCYQLFTICEQKKWAAEAGAYNGLITSWPELSQLAEDQRGEILEQGELI